MICNNCGKELKEGTKFCGYCGKKIAKGNNVLKIILKILGIIISLILAFAIGMGIFFGGVKIKEFVSSKSSSTNEQVESIKNNVQNNTYQNRKKEEYIFTPYQNVEIVSQSGSNVSFRGVCPTCGKKTEIRSRSGSGTSIINSHASCSNFDCDVYYIKIGVKLIEF